MKKLLFTIALLLLASPAILAQSVDAERKYEEISQITTAEERRRWFALQAPEVKAAIWRGQFTRKLADPGLTKEQIELLVKVREVITPKLMHFNKGKSPREMTELQPLIDVFNEEAARAVKIFTREEVEYLFSVFGDHSTLVKEN